MKNAPERPKNLPLWATAAISAVVLGGCIWANESAPQVERNEIRTHCAGVHMLVGVRASGLSGESSRRATYICIADSSSLLQEYEVLIRNNRPVEVIPRSVWWPYIIFAMFLYSAWRSYSAWRRRAA